MKLFLLASFLAAAFAVPIPEEEERFDYTGYKVLAVGPLSRKAEVKVLEMLRDDETGKVQIYNDIITTKEVVSMAVSPDSFGKISTVLNKLSIKFEIVEEDLQKKYDRNLALNTVAKAQFLAKSRKTGQMAAPTYYMRFSEMMNWLTTIANQHSIASRFTLGNSYQGRTTYGIAINNGRNLPAVWIDAGIHAREWIAPATALYIIDRILNGNDADAVYMRNNFRFYIAPEVNPDGYEYTWTNNRNWRKNRAPNGGCIGTDPNRNFDTNWRRYGTSTNPCSDTYGGPSAFSEPESRNMRDAILARNSNMNVIISMHSFSELWLVPWAGQLNKPSDYSQLKSAGDRAAVAIRNVNGRSFRVGTPPDILYAASGGTYDWGKEKAGIKYAYTPELRPATIWQGGFDIPPSNILPSGAEIFAGVVSICRDSRR